jgi:trehalose 6-phosphate synthase/phosphatase
MSTQYSILNLRVKAETDYGQVIHVSGSSYTMGNFSTSEVRLLLKGVLLPRRWRTQQKHVRGSSVQAVPLVTSPEDYPYWRTSRPLVVPRGVPQVMPSTT